MTTEKDTLTELKSESRKSFLADEDGLFNASSLAREYGKEVYGYTRGQKVKELVRQIAEEYNLDPKCEFTERGNIVRVISGGTAPGTWMHLDIFIKFLGWLDPKIERDFMKSIFSSYKKTEIDPLQEELAQEEALATSLRRRLARVPYYKDLLQSEKKITKLKRKIDKISKSKRKDIVENIRMGYLLLGNGKQ